MHELSLLPLEACGEGAVVFVLQTENETFKEVQSLSQILRTHGLFLQNPV